MRRAAKLRALDDVVKIRVPLSLIHVKDDWLIGHGHSEALFSRASEPKEMHILDVGGNYQ